jgi:triphosphoribosyl-dephospho-CoA synthase
MVTTLDRLDPTILAGLAVDALRSEALLTPKPGLVDRNGSGAHNDMTLSTLLSSADSLRDTFLELAVAGTELPTGQALRDRVGVLGRIGEASMLEATNGTNTHRGALWTLGLLVTAAATAASEDEIFASAARLAQFQDSAGAPASTSHGQKAISRYGVSGAVGEATAGFPHIVKVALPTLRASRARGNAEQVVSLRTLFALIATLDDTCILHRGGAGGLKWMQRSARRASHQRDFAKAATTFADQADKRRLSPGGSADLLAGAFLMDRLAHARAGSRSSRATHTLANPKDR